MSLRSDDDILAALCEEDLNDSGSDFGGDDTDEDPDFVPEEEDEESDEFVANEEVEVANCVEKCVY